MPGSQKELFEEYIQTLEDDELPWYEKEVNSAIMCWRVLGITSLAISVASALIAALIPQEFFPRYGRTALVVLPIIGSAIVGVSQQFRFKEREALREIGRIELTDIIANAKSIWLEADGNEDRYRKGYHQVRERFHQMEISQHNAYLAMNAEPSPDSAEARKLR